MSDQIALGAVVRAGFAPVKGTRHLSVDRVELDAHGPVGDRDWCLVDVARHRVLRTSGNSLLDVVVRPRGSEVEVVLPDGRTVSSCDSTLSDPIVIDYWGRPATVTPYDGAVGEALSQHLGCEVRLGRTIRGAVVYGDPVSLIGTASVADLAARMGEPRIADQPERFRSTLVVDTDEPWAEDSWVGRELALGDAVVRISAPIGRCGVINLDPDTGLSDARLLKALAQFRPSNPQGEPLAAVDARVVTPGVVAVGDQVRIAAPALPS